MGSRCGGVGLTERELIAGVKAGVEAHCKATGDTFDIIGEDIGVCQSALSNMLNCTDYVRVDRLIKLLTATNSWHHFGRACAKVAGAIWTVMPKGNPSYETLGAVFKEIGEVGVEFTSAMADGTITEKEKVAILKQIADAKQALVDLEVAVEQMHKPGNVTTLKGAM